MTVRWRLLRAASSSRGPTIWSATGARSSNTTGRAPCATPGSIYTREQSTPELSSVYYGCVMTRTGFRLQPRRGPQGHQLRLFGRDLDLGAHLCPRPASTCRGPTRPRPLRRRPPERRAGGCRRKGGRGLGLLFAAVGGQQAGRHRGRRRPVPAFEEHGDSRRSARNCSSEVRVIALTDPIPNDVCCVRRGFPKTVWQQVRASMQRFLETPEGLGAYYDLVAGVAAHRAPMPILTSFARP